MTAASAEAAARYGETVSAFLGFSRETGASLKATLAADPDLPMGHCIKGYFYKLFALPALEKKAVQSLEAGQKAADSRNAMAREETHLSALQAWCAGDYVRATDLWEAILAGHPRDALALRLSHFTHFYLGESEPLRDSVARVLPAWDEAVPGAGFVRGMYAFGLEEAGDYRAAEAMGRRAVEINPADIWGVHAVAHVMEMEGRHKEGIDWLTGLADAWRGCNNFAYHVWWHLALFHLERAEYDEALALYDTRIRADETEDYLDISNGVALLWRLADAGVDVGARWDELADKAEAHSRDHLLAFADPHYAMALAAGGRYAAADTMIASLRALRDDPRDIQAAVLRAVGLPLCEAIVAFHRKDYARAADLLLPVRGEIRRIGGSHAQRDLFAQLLIAALLKSGRFAEARDLLAERTSLRPRSARAWRDFAAALEAMGDATGADRARLRAEETLTAG